MKKCSNCASYYSDDLSHYCRICGGPLLTAKKPFFRMLLEDRPWVFYIAGIAVLAVIITLALTTSKRIDTREMFAVRSYWSGIYDLENAGPEDEVNLQKLTELSHSMINLRFESFRYADSWDTKQYYGKTLICTKDLTLFYRPATVVLIVESNHVIGVGYTLEESSVDDFSVIKTSMTKLWGQSMPRYGLNLPLHEFTMFYEDIYYRDVSEWKTADKAKVFALRSDDNLTAIFFSCD